MRSRAGHCVDLRDIEQGSWTMSNREDEQIANGEQLSKLLSEMSTETEVPRLGVPYMARHEPNKPNTQH